MKVFDQVVKRFLIIIHLSGLFLVAANAQLCPGTAGEVKWSYWRALPDDEFGELSANEFYPEYPDGHQVLNALETPYRFDNFYGSLIRGYIRIPTTENIVFNVTGDNKVEFFLSTNHQPSNLRTIAFTHGATGQEEHDKYPEQTSLPISLSANAYYYFELIHVEAGGSDHAAVWWKTSFTDPANWNVIRSNYLYDVGCIENSCSERGTPCNDGDANSTNDQYDGFCNCVGRPITANSCVGERFSLASYFYDNIPGNYLEDLYDYINFPTLPDRGENLVLLGRFRQNSHENYGSLVQGFLTVPESGPYSFNITGDNQSIFFLSSNDDPANKQAHQALTDYSTGMTDHEDRLYQSTGPIHLETGRYYYFEINHKQGGGWGHYRVFWKTPWRPEVWKNIPLFYLYDYTCELACIPAGTACDDGDPFTNNDQYDTNCTCVGTPCSGPDCDDPVASYVPFSECGLTNELDDRGDMSWLSCNESASANATRGSHHWLQYDLGSEHRLYSSQVWNYNVAGQTSKGIKTVVIDYSEDGINWIELGQYNWPVATGTSHYAGFVGPEFGGVKARYILFTILDNQACAGFSKIAITARQCGPEGSVCDDGNPLSYNDRFDANCQCSGVVGNPMDCILDSLTLGDSLLLGSNYSAIRFLESQSTVMKNSTVQFTASENIQLNPGFENESGGTLILQLESCGNQLTLSSGSIRKALRATGKEKPLSVVMLDKDDRQSIQYYIDSPGIVNLVLQDEAGIIRSTLASHYYRNEGFYRKRVNTKKLEPGMYLVKLTTSNNVYTDKMIVGYK